MARFLNGYFPEIFLLLFCNLIPLWTEKTSCIQFKESVQWCLGSLCPQHSLEKLSQGASGKISESFQGSLSVVTWCLIYWNPFFHIFYSVFQVLLRQEGWSNFCQSNLARNRHLNFVVRGFEYIFQPDHICKETLGLNIQTYNHNYIPKRFP